MAVGKWLYFGEKDRLHSWLPRLDVLVERRSLMAAKISRKDPKFDLFPHKPCVLCVFTADDDNERAQAKQLLAREFGIEVKTWKSDAQTMRDWAEDGWLRIELEISKIKRALASGESPNSPEIVRELRALTDRLSNLAANPTSVTLAEELRLSQTDNFIRELKSNFGHDDLTLSIILNKLDQLQSHILRISNPHNVNLEYEAIDKDPRREYIFVMMPFGIQHVDTYDAIRRSILKVNSDLRVERVDEKPGSAQILNEIYKSIRSASLIIADMTDEKPNVYYELGYTHALEKPTVCLAREGTIIHFDLSGFKVIFFKTLRELEESLFMRLAGFSDCHVETIAPTHSVRPVTRDMQVPRWVAVRPR